MMNIFIMILVALFMAGYYLIDSPSQRIQKHETEYAIERSDLRAIAQCAVAVHNAQINSVPFQDVCIEQNGIGSEFICLNAKFKQTDCNAEGRQKPAFSYIVTYTAPIDPQNHNAMMEILEEHYAESGTFGMFNDKTIISGGTSTKRIVPAEIISKLKLVDNQLVYLTHYEKPQIITTNFDAVTADVNCPTGTVKTYRFGRWQCIGQNTKTDCGGDTIWDSDLQECVADERRKPLCANDQTAILIDSVWDCISPFPDRKCPNKMIARLNYNTMEWECVIDPTTITESKKCDSFIQGNVYAAPGTTLRIPQTSCTDCERMITDPDTCESICVPDPSKLDSPRCYAGNIADCSGASRALYFGFPNRGYIDAIKDFENIDIPLDSQHNQNRRFNCMDCGTGTIDTEKSVSPYVAICK